VVDAGHGTGSFNNTANDKGVYVKLKEHDQEKGFRREKEPSLNG